MIEYWHDDHVMFFTLTAMFIFPCALMQVALSLFFMRKINKDKEEDGVEEPTISIPTWLNRIMIALHVILMPMLAW